MLDHARAQDLAAASLDFDLPIDEQVELDTHLATCPGCRAHLDGLRLDARTLADRPRADAPERVRRRVAPEPRSAPAARLRLAAAMVGLLVVGLLVVAGTGGLRFGTDDGTAVVSPSSTAVASGGPATRVSPTTSLAPATPGPRLPATAWQDVTAQPAFGIKQVTPVKDTSTPSALPCTDCGDTSVRSRGAVIRAAVETDDGIVAVGHGCVGGERVTCQADVWRSADGLRWEAVPHDASLDAGSDNWVTRPTGMMDVVAGPEGLVAGGAVSQARQMRATIWTSSDGQSWQQTALDHEGEGGVAAVAAGPSGVVAIGRIRTEDGVTAAAWASSDGTTWEPATTLDGAALGRSTGDEQDVAGMFDVVWAGERFVAVGAACAGPDPCHVVAWTSPDGRSWSLATTGSAGAGRMRSIAYLGSGLVAVGDDGTSEDAAGRVWTSTDAIHWIPAEIEAGVDRPAPLRVVVAVGAEAIASGDGYAVQSSDGRSWIRSDDDVLAHATVFGLAAGAGGIIATGQETVVEVDDVFEAPPAVWLLPYR